MKHQQKFSKFLVFMLTCVILMSSCSAQTKNENEFRVGMECGYSPFNWTQMDDSNGAVKIKGSNQYANGYDVQIAKLVAEDMDKELVIIKTAWEGLIPGLQSNKLDGVIAGMSATAERKEEIDFSDSYYSSDLVVVVKKDGPFANAKTLDDFENARITGQQGTTHYKVIDQLTGANKHTALADFPTMILALMSGNIDGYISEKPGALGATHVNPELTYIEFPDDKGFVYDKEEVTIGIGLVKGNPIKEDINTALSKISEEEREDIMANAVSMQPAEEAETNETFMQSVKGVIQKYGSHFIRGAGTTLFIALIGTIVGLFIGLLVAACKTIPKIKGRKLRNALIRFVNILINIYVEVFRGTPMMVQATVFYYGLSQLFDIDINPLIAGLIIVSVNTGAYMAEVVRGGIESVPSGQAEAAKALGMSHGQMMKNVIFPQAIRNILPATGNEFVINIKDTSVLNVISVTELFYAAKDVQANTLKMFESYLITAVIYLFLTFTITRILRLIERKMDGPQNYTLTSSTMPETVNIHQKQKEEAEHAKHN